jgi:hypothetical protein
MKTCSQSRLQAESAGLFRLKAGLRTDFASADSA